MLLTAIERAEVKVEVAASIPNIRSSVEVAKSQVFDKTVEKVLEFLTAYKLFIRIRIRRDLMKKQIQSYI